MPEEAERRRLGRTESGGKAGRPLGGHRAPCRAAAGAGGQGLRSGEGRVGSARGIEEEGEGKKRRAGGPRLLGVGPAAGVTQSPGATGPHCGSGGGWGRTGLQSLLRAPLPTLRDPRALPLPERPVALPSQLSSGPSSAALVRAWVQQGPPTRQQGRRTDGRPRVGSLGPVGFPQAFPSSRTPQCPRPG
ncbi:hypothetical protein HJG60_009634 [Phyllostomus discolor]|uniref:Uncharacterized protein n=1 Tax=Phyllostomus discolor TaxID=89673 RepID=A0A834B952_9CHIR|nr:hypothetical protein HJG60_009634 [Phyllostomus discolor]